MKTTLEIPTHFSPRKSVAAETWDTLRLSSRRLSMTNSGMTTQRQSRGWMLSQAPRSYEGNGQDQLIYRRRIQQIEAEDRRDLGHEGLSAVAMRRALDTISAKPLKSYHVFVWGENYRYGISPYRTGSIRKMVDEYLRNFESLESTTGHRPVSCGSHGIEEGWERFHPTMLEKTEALCRPTLPSAFKPRRQFDAVPGIRRLEW